MKTYNQLVNQAVLVGAHAYFGGGNHWRGAHNFVDAATFIYDISRDQFLDDFDKRWNEVMVKREADNMFADDVIAYIKNS